MPFHPAALLRAGRAIEMHDPAHTRQFQEIMLLIGQLNYTWTNTESLLIYLIKGLARVDKETSIIIFLTLNTTRARADLVERLAKMKTTPETCRSKVLAVMTRFMSESKLRNKYNHCIYSFDEGGSTVHTQLMRLVDSKDEVRYGKLEELGDDEMQRIRTSIASIGQINADMWTIIHEYGFQP
jgi:hypothetical protein